MFYTHFSFAQLVKQTAVEDLNDHGSGGWWFATAGGGGGVWLSGAAVSVAGGLTDVTERSTTAPLILAYVEHAVYQRVDHGIGHSEEENGRLHPGAEMIVWFEEDVDEHHDIVRNPTDEKSSSDDDR